MPYGSLEVSLRRDRLNACGVLLVAFTCLSAGATGLVASDANVFVGTAGVGHTTPAAAYPFGFVQAGPDTSAKSDAFAGNWDHSAGYQYGDGFVWRFSQTHLFGTGCPSLGDIAIMPFVRGFDPVERAAVKLPETESGAPGRYALSVRENDKTIRCEICALAHSAAYRISYPKGVEAHLLVDLDWGMAPVGRGDCWGEYVIQSLRGGRKAWFWNDCQTHFAMTFSASVRSVAQRRTANLSLRR